MNAQNPSKHSQSFTDRFERLYHHYYKRMTLTAFVVLQDTFEAQDAVNDAFVAMADAFDDLQKLDDVSAGAYMINKARGCALALLKKGKHKAIQRFICHSRSTPKCLVTVFWNSRIAKTILIKCWM